MPTEAEYTMIRAKKIRYLERPAVAIYFENMTQHVHQLRTESKLLEEKNKTQSLESYTSTISHEFRTPLGTSLMFLERLQADSSLSESSFHIINLIISHMNLLLSLVNDVLDIKMIKQGKYEVKSETFNPVNLLDFIVAMFVPQSQMQRTKISYQTVSALAHDSAIQHKFN